MKNLKIVKVQDLEKPIEGMYVGQTSGVYGNNYLVESNETRYEILGISNLRRQFQNIKPGSTVRVSYVGTDPSTTIPTILCAVEVISTEIYFTQAQLAEMLGVRATRICELTRFGVLKHAKKEGRTFKYAEKDVQEALKIPYVQTWVEATSKIDMVSQQNEPT